MAKSARLSRKRHLPISYRAVAEERSLESLLLERVLSNFFFVDRNAQTGLRIWRQRATCFRDCNGFFNDVVPPGNVRMHRFADDVARLRETKFQRSGGADWPLRIVRRKSNSIGVGQCRNATRLAKAAAVGDVELTNAASAASKN